MGRLQIVVTRRIDTDRMCAYLRGASVYPDGPIDLREHMATDGEHVFDAGHLLAAASLQTAKLGAYDVYTYAEWADMIADAGGAWEA